MNEDAGRLKDGELVEQRWEVQHLLGMGELAEVYEVADRWTGGSAVLKLFAPQYLMAPAAWAGYQEYCERIRALSLPALVNPFAFGIHPQSAAPFSVAERVGLPALDQLVATVGTLLPAQFARILRELAPLLDTVHRAGIVHRNLKPSNLFCSLQGSKGLQVSDTTVSALRRELAPFPGWGATPGWVAPEALDPRAPEHASMDIYAVGLLAFFALTDRNPFLSLLTFEPAHFQQELSEPLPRMSERARELGTRLDPKFDRWFERALAMDPNARFPSVLSMANELLELALPASGFGSTVALAPAWSPAASEASALLTPSIRAPALSADPGVASASVQPLLFNEALPRSIPAAQAVVAAVPPPTASPRALPAAERPTYNAKPVLLAAAGTGAIAVVAAVIVTVVLMREREARRGGALPALAPTEVAPPTAPSAPSSPEPAPPTSEARTSASSAPEPEPGNVKFECSPEPCTSVHCDGREHTDLTKSIELAPGEHRCVGGAEGYLPVITTFELVSKQELVQALELKKKAKLPDPLPEPVTQPPAAKPPAAKPPAAKPPAAKPPAAKPPAAKPPAGAPCGTFINPCK